jgi:hypothetical protein
MFLFGTVGADRFAGFTSFPEILFFPKSKDQQPIRGFDVYRPPSNP